jgi:hypothetical protein
VQSATGEGVEKSDGSSIAIMQYFEPLAHIASGIAIAV